MASPTKAQLLERLTLLEGEMLTRELATVHDHRNEPLDPAWAAGGVTLLGFVYASIRGKLKGIQAQAAADQLKAQSNSTTRES